MVHDKSANPLLIFDFGNVIVPYDDKLLVRNMAALCRWPAEARRDIPLYLARYMNALQTGRMSDEGLYEKFVEELKFKGDFRVFQQAWCSHIGHHPRQGLVGCNPKMERLVTDLARSHTVVVLSNSTQTHWDHYNKHYPVLGKLDGRYASHLLGVMKPDREIYHTVIRAEKRKPEDAIFIDDLQFLASGAERAGLRKGIVFTGHDNLVVELTALGVKWPVPVEAKAPMQQQISPRTSLFSFIKRRQPVPGPIQEPA